MCQTINHPLGADQQNLKKHLLESSDLYKSLFEYHPDAIYALDRQGRYILVNGASEGIIGYTIAEIEHMKFTDFVSAENVKIRQDTFQKALAGIPQTYETVVFHKKGHEVFTHVTYVPIRMNEQIVGVFGITKDITSRKLAEKKVRESENSLALAQKVAHMGNWDVDLIEHNVTWSAEMYHIFGVKPGAIVPSYERFVNFIYPEDRQTVQAKIAEAMLGKPLQIEFRSIGADGVVRNLYAQGERITDSTGTPVRFIGTMQDLTEKRKMEESRRKSEALFKLISENTQDIITYSSPEGICLYISPAITSALGYAPEDIIGKSVTELWHAEDVERIQDYTFVDTDVITCRIRHQQGEYLWFEISYKTIRDEKGDVESILGVARDVTARKKAEMELLSTKELLDSFVELNVDAIAFFDKECRLLRINPAFERLFGWLEQELLGMAIETLPYIPQEEKSLEEVRQTRDLILSGKTVIAREMIRINKKGEQRYVSLSAFPIHDVGGECNGWSVTMRDISEQKQVENMILQSEKLSVAGQLAAGIAHEIRNPLTALKGFTQLLRYTENKKDEYLKIMESEMNRIELILSELLVLAKPQAGSPGTQVDVAQSISDVIALFDSQAHLHNIELSFEKAADVPPISGDANQLKQVFVNLLKNAVEAMPGGGRIVIALGAEQQHVYMKIIDQGHGIPDTALQKIGEPFYTTKEKGTGLGMMISKKIIESHHGTMKIQSEQGVGTTVEIVLPMCEYMR